ncbi:TIGR02652 family protein [Trichocoleus desertorum GB2-A4]|uniref:TIGR02652 family protein n=2 Tax=Trichocoleusaceae TaxID=2303527 RepID=A0ABV0JES7_9CYAN
MSGLVLTESYVCHLHGQFDAKPDNQELEFADTRKCWRRLEDQWYRCHRRFDTLEYEIGEALSYGKFNGGLHALTKNPKHVTKIVVSRRYESLVEPYRQLLEEQRLPLTIFGIPTEFSPDPQEEPRWNFINFELERQTSKIIIEGLDGWTQEEWQEAEKSGRLELKVFYLEESRLWYATLNRDTPNTSNCTAMCETLAGALGSLAKWVEQKTVPGSGDRNNSTN